MSVSNGSLLPPVDTLVIPKMRSWERCYRARLRRGWGWRPYNTARNLWFSARPQAFMSGQQQGKLESWKHGQPQTKLQSLFSEPGICHTADTINISPIFIHSPFPFWYTEPHPVSSSAEVPKFWSHSAAPHLQHLPSPLPCLSVSPKSNSPWAQTSQWTHQLIRLRWYGLLWDYCWMHLIITLQGSTLLLWLDNMAAWISALMVNVRKTSSGEKRPSQASQVTRGTQVTISFTSKPQVRQCGHSAICPFPSRAAGPSNPSCPRHSVPEPSPTATCAWKDTSASLSLWLQKQRKKQRDTWLFCHWNWKTVLEKKMSRSRGTYFSIKTL